LNPCFEALRTELGLPQYVFTKAINTLLSSNNIVRSTETKKKLAQRMKAEVKWIEDLKFVGKTDKNQEIIFGSGETSISSFRVNNLMKRSWQK